MWFDFKKLGVWQKAIELNDKVYSVVSKFPKEEVYWITSQIKRSSISISSNIAEWNDRDSQNEFRRFLLISKWSIAELETQLIISERQLFISKDELNNLQSDIIEIRKMLNSLISKL